MADANFQRFLLVDDDPLILSLLSAALQQKNIDVATAQNFSELERRLTNFRYDSIILDLGLGNEDGIDAIPMILRTAPYAKLIILTGTNDIELAANAVFRGASGLIRKNSDINITVQEILKQTQSSALSIDASGKVEDIDCGIIGNCPEIAALKARIRQIAQVDSTVLILGESGTGKELVARGLHTFSPRSGGRFEAINCSAIPENLLEAELFGYKRGAFTDAKSDRKGYFELCTDGTLFLDEIGEMPLNLQSKLLRVLQERTVTPLGCSKSIHINTRVVAATNRDLRERVRAGMFREDLYFRLSVVPMTVPSLRQRKDDIPLLINYFLAKFNERFNRTIAPPSRDIIARMMAYDWPGNVRELQNAIERGVVLATCDKLSLDNIFLGSSKQESEDDKSDHDSISGSELASWFRLPLTEAKSKFERAYLKSVLSDAAGNVSEAARKSGRYRPDLYRLMHKYGVTTGVYTGE